MRILPTHRQLRRARFRFLLRVFAVLAVALAIFGAVVALGYLLGQ